MEIFKKPQTNPNSQLNSTRHKQRRAGTNSTETILKKKKKTKMRKRDSSLTHSAKPALHWYQNLTKT